MLQTNTVSLRTSSDNLTSIDTYAVQPEPATYYPAITSTTPTHTRKPIEEEWELVQFLWFIRKGFLRGVIENLRDALDEQYYAQLKHRLMAYRNIIPFQILEHSMTAGVPSAFTQRRSYARNITPSGTATSTWPRSESDSITTNVHSYNLMSPLLTMTSTILSWRNPR